MIYLIGGFGSAIFLFLSNCIPGIKKNFILKKRISLIGKDREIIYFLMIGIILSILILAGKPGA